MTASTQSADSDWHVICLCAAWCGVCRDWQPALRELANKHPELRIAWIDVEDEDEAMGDVEVETFPTVLIAHGSEVRFFGPVVPSGPQLAQLVARLQAQAQPHAGSPGHEARDLLARLGPLRAEAAL